MSTDTKNKNSRGSAAQFFVAGELCRRGLIAVVTMGNTPTTDILCSNLRGTKFVHIQVKTYEPGRTKVTVGKKAEIDNGEKFIWVLAGIPTSKSQDAFEYYIIPSPVVAKNVKEGHGKWLVTPGRNNQQHDETTMRIIDLPPQVSNTGWSVEQYRNKWDIIENLLD